MYGYRCDICNAPIQVDPSDVRLCAECEEKQMIGYEGICCEDGIFVRREDAYEYALERISCDESLKKELVEWFYSGNFIPVMKEEDKKVC